MEEDIFGENCITLVLRYNDNVTSKFNKQSNSPSFDKIKDLLDSKEMQCYFSKKDDKRHIITIPVSIGADNGMVKFYVGWNVSNSYEIKVNKECKSRYVPEFLNIDKKYTIEQNCKVRFLGMQDIFSDGIAIDELIKLKKRIDDLEIAPTTIIENERQLWTKYIEAQRLIVDKLQEPFRCNGKCHLESSESSIVKKLHIPIENAGAPSHEAFDDFTKEYEKYFGSTIGIEKDGAAWLTKEEIERTDTMILRKYGDRIERQEKITCTLQIAPLEIQDLLKAKMANTQVYHDKKSKLLYISRPGETFATIPRKIMEKYGLKATGVCCIYKKYDESDKCSLEFEREEIKSPYMSELILAAKKMSEKAKVKKAKLEKEGYKKVNYSVGQAYTFNDANNNYSDDFHARVKSDLYGLDISISKSKKRLCLSFEFTNFETLQERLDELHKNNKFKLTKADIDKMLFKVHFYQVEKKDKLDSFEYKKEKLKNVEFVRIATPEKEGKGKQIFVGNLSGRETTEKELVFRIPYHSKEEKEKAKPILEKLEDKNFEIGYIRANLRGDEAKLEWLDEAVKKLAEERIHSIEPNSKPVNPRLRDFIFDSSKAEPTYRFDIGEDDIPELSEFKEMEHRQLLNLNQSQKNAVLKALYAKDLCLLQGPPGTGKTTVIAELIWQHILKDPSKRLLLTSETNLAVDNALEKLMGARNVDESLTPYLSIIKPLRFGQSSKFEEEGKKYSIERIEKWLGDEYEEENTYENETASIENTTEDSFDNQEDDDVNNNAVQQWMKMIAQRSQTYTKKNPKYSDLTKAYIDSLVKPDGITKRYFKEKYFKHANVIGSTCSSTGSPSFASDYARINYSAIYDKYVAKEGYKQTIADIQGLLSSAQDDYNSFHDTASSIIKRIMKENNVKKVDELRELLSDPTDNLRHYLFDYDFKRLLKPKRVNKFDSILERMGINSENEFNQVKNIYFDTVIMDEASKATPPDLALPLCFGRKSIIIGDHRQLPPMLNEQDFKEALLSLNDKKAEDLAKDIDRQFVGASQFARLILNPKVSKSIKSVFSEQYRMHPQINDVIKQFYENDEGGLTCGLDLKKVDCPNLSEPESRYHGFSHPGFIAPDVHVLWVKVDEPEQRSDSNALYNEKEVEAVRRVLLYLKHSEGFEKYMKYWDDNMRNEERRNQEKEIGIISFYAQQVQCLKKGVMSIARSNGIRIKLNTVDKFQGMERNIVIVSTVRSNKYKTGRGIMPNDNPGFAKSPERLNVALSRARRLLIVVGNNEFFDHVKDVPGGNLLYHNVIEEMKKYHDIVDYKTLTKYGKEM